MAALAQYERIVADIRTRIADGRLTPGDRLPSTRQLAKDWGVALATATKALTALQQQGVVVSQPRVGTVVAGVTTTAVPADAPLSREQVVRAAIELADAEGLDALSMRGVAARLGVATMSTYRHVTSKDQLILLMADTAFGEAVEVAGAGEPGGWRDLLARAARTMWALYRRHPWLAHVTPLTRPLPLPNLVAHGERMLEAFQAVGAFRLDPQSLQDLQVLVFSHVQGLAMQLEGEARALADTGIDEDGWMAVNGAGFAGITGSGRYPRFTALMAAFGAAGGYDLDLDEQFELGLDVLLDGLAVRFADPDRRRGTRRR